MTTLNENVLSSFKPFKPRLPKWRKWLLLIGIPCFLILSDVFYLLERIFCAAAEGNLLLPGAMEAWLVGQMFGLIADYFWHEAVDTWRMVKDGE